MRHLLRALALVLTILLCQVTFAATYYVKNGGNDGGAGTSGDPWASISKVNGSVSPGDTVYFDNASTWSASSGTAVLLMSPGVAYIGDEWGSGTRAKLQANSSSISRAVVYFNDDDATYETVLQGFEVDGNQYEMDGVSMLHNGSESSNLTGATKRIQNCVVHDVSDLGNWYGYGIIIAPNGTNESVSDVEILDNVVYNIGRTGINIYPYTGCSSCSCNISDVTVTGNETYNLGQDQGSAGHGILLKNNITNVTVECNLNRSTGSSGHSIAVEDYCTDPTYLTIRYNIMVDNIYYYNVDTGTYTVSNNQTYAGDPAEPPDFDSYCGSTTNNWYFSAAGDDEDGNGTITNPWQTMSKARTSYNALGSGNDVYFNFNRGDTFTFNNTGFDYLYIDVGKAYFNAYGSGANPVLDGGVDFSAGNPLDSPATRNRWDAIIRFSTGSEGSSVSNIDFKNHHGAAISNGGDHSNITIQYCNFENLGMHAVSIGPSNSVIEYSTADLCQRLEEYDYHVGMWGAAFAFRGSGGNNIIRYSRVTRTYGEGIYLESGGTAEKCIVGPTYSVGIYVVPHATTATSGYVIKHNIVYGYKNTTIPGTVENYRGNDNGIGICDESAGGSNSVTVDIVGNFIVHRRWGMRIYDLDGSAIWGAVDIHNNTVIDSYLNNYEFEAADRYSTVKFYNNASIYYDITSTFLDEGHVYDNIGNDPDYTREYNLFWPVNGTFPVDQYWDDNYVTNDPTLTATSGWTEPPPSGIVPYDTSEFDFGNLVPELGSALFDSGTTISGDLKTILTAITDVTGTLSASSFVTADTTIDGYPEIGALTENVSGSSETVYCVNTRYEANSPGGRIEANAPAMIAQVQGQEQSQSCDTSQFGETGATSGSLFVARYETSTYRGGQFVYTGSDAKQICAVSLWLNFSGSSEHNYYVRIYSDSSGSPSSVLGTSDVRDLSSIGSSETEVTFTFSTPTSALSNSGTYWVVLYSASYDGSNYVNWNYEDNGATERSTFSGDGSAWTSADGTTTFKFELFSLGD